MRSSWFYIMVNQQIPRYARHQVRNRHGQNDKLPDVRKPGGKHPAKVLGFRAVSGEPVANVKMRRDVDAQVPPGHPSPGIARPVGHPAQRIITSKPATVQGVSAGRSLSKAVRQSILEHLYG
jgi:hypothetical protein